MRYRVLKCIDTEGEEYYIGHVGKDTGKRPGGMIELLFSDGDKEHYWPEELELLHNGQPDWEV